MTKSDRAFAASRRSSGPRARLILVTIGALAIVAACTTTPPPQTLTVSFAGTGAGTVRSAPGGIDCTDDCAAEFPLDTSVTLTATPLGGSTFEGWSGACDSAAATCTVDMAEALAVTANFTAPEAQSLACVPVDEGAGGPTLVCTLADERVVITLPWQGRELLVRSLPVDGLGFLPARYDFEPLSLWPVVRIGVVDAADEQPVLAFDPALELTVRYGSDEFDASDPTVDAGELGLGVWDEAAEDWIVVGHGVFHEGFWVADPIGGGDLTLRGDPFVGQPRFAMKGTPTAGEAVALVATTPTTLPIAWGAMPFDEDHMLMEFDSCADVVIEAVPTVECVASMAGVTLRVPVQEGGTVTPRVIALPWNKMTTFDVASPQVAPSQQSEPEVERLMNFLVVDAAEPTRFLETFDPPLEFDIAYAPEDVDPVAHPYFGVVYWDEYEERFVTLAEGYPVEGECYPDGFFDEGSGTYVYGDPAAGCAWGYPVAASGVSELNGSAFRWDDVDPTVTGGVARFTYDIWGDRIIALVR